MGKSQPTYTKEFKPQAANLFETSGKTKTQIARDLGISDSALEFLVQRVWRAWGRSLSREGPSNSSRRLRREVEVLRQEREIGSQKL